MSEAKILTNTVLKETMSDALVYRGYVTNADTCVAPGIYRIEPNAVGNPSSARGIMEVLKVNETLMQRITQLSYAPTVFLRITNLQDFSTIPWRKIMTEAVS